MMRRHKRRRPGLTGPSVSVAVVDGSVRLCEAIAAADKAQKQGCRHDEDAGHDVVLLRDHANPSQEALQSGNTQTQDGIAPSRVGDIELKNFSIDHARIFQSEPATRNVLKTPT